MTDQPERERVTLWRCPNCDFRASVDLIHCPQCDWRGTAEPGRDFIPADSSEEETRAHICLDCGLPVADQALCRDHSHRSAFLPPANRSEEEESRGEVIEQTRREIEEAIACLDRKPVTDGQGIRLHKTDIDGARRILNDALIHLRVASEEARANELAKAQVAAVQKWAESGCKFAEQDEPTPIQRQVATFLSQILAPVSPANRSEEGGARGCTCYIENHDTYEGKAPTDIADCPVHSRSEEGEAREQVIEEVLAELSQATARFGPMASPHEGYAVVQEELDELWDEIKGAQTSRRMREEAVQVAAMAIRFVTDCCLYSEREHQAAVDASLARMEDANRG